MKVLVAASAAEHDRDDDFNFVPEGELLHEGLIVCCNSDSCGCNRAMGGMDALKSTTVAKVVEMDIDRDDVYDLAGKTGRATGWGGEIILKRLQNAIEAAKELEVGTLVRASFDFDTESWVYGSVTP